MAQISGNIDEKVFAIKTFLGLNENPDGDTKLKMGEAAISRNFRVTRDGNLQRRPGTKTVVDLETSKPIKGLWTGFVNGHEYMIGACDGKLYKFWDDVSNEFEAAPIGRASGSFSGPVASFETDDEYPITALSVAVEPQQDLHGYDHPWPAGGGKNLFDKDAIEMGKWIDVGSTTISTANGYAVTDYIPVTQGTIYYFGAKGSASSAYYDSDKNGIEYFAYSGGSAFTAQYTGFMRFTLYAVDMQALVSTLQFEKGNAATAYAPYSNICPISGRTSATVTRTGVNVWNEEWEVGGISTADGSKYNDKNRIRSKNYIPVVPNTNYYFSISNVYDSWKVAFYDSNYSLISITYKKNSTLTTPSNCRYIMIAENQTDYGTTYHNDISINYPSTDTDYHAYTGTSLSLTWSDHGTVYGGTVDLVSGVLTVDRAMVDLGTLTWAYNSTVKFFQADISNVAPVGYTEIPNAICSMYATGSIYTVRDGSMIGFALNQNGMVYVRDPVYTDVATFKTAMNGVQLCYELATPFEITLTPTQITTLVGQNNVWSDAGDVTVETDVSQTRVNTDNDVHIFGFSNICYIMDGVSYKQYDGTTLTDVVGYRPLVTISVPPAGGGETLENVNRLSGMRRMWISTTGEDATYFLPEKQIKSIDYVKNLATGEDLPSTAYSVSLGDADTFASVTFNSIPAQATNGYEIGWTIENANTAAMRAQVTSMRYSEIYSGRQDARVFIYGDGTNKCLYSGIDYNGDPRADYFPDLYEISVGDANTPITAMIRHYFSLMCYKSNSAWMIEATNYTLADSSEIPAFWVVPINRAIGNAAPGQVRLVLNSPYTLFGNDLYEWKNNASYASNLNVDERQAKRISDRVWATIKKFDVSKCYCFDDNDAQEYYICYDGQALVYNYAANAWSYYTQFPVSCMTFMQKELFLGSPDGKLKRVSYEYLNDDGEAVDAYWESGSMSFGKDFMRKYAAMLWVGIKPEGVSEVYVTVQTDRNSQLNEKVVESTLSTFAKANFARWSFSVNRKPHMKRLKIKAKKFVFYKLIFKCTSADTRATILAADIRVRMTGYAK